MENIAKYHGSNQILPTSTMKFRKSFIQQLTRFGLVGITNTAIDVLAFNVLVGFFPTQDANQLLFFNSCAYMVGAINSFCWNKLWTFEQRTKATSGQWVRFAFVTSIGILLNDVLLWLATSLLAKFSISGLLWTNVAKISAIAGTVAISYIGMRFGVFTKSEKDMMPIPPPLNPHLFTTPRSLSVVLPAYNEEANIENTVITIISTLTTWLKDFEVIVVNDGSKDRTAEIVARISTFDQRIRLINHSINLGYGSTLVTGFESIRKETVFFMDSDGQFDISDLARFFPLIEEYDAVLGYRMDRMDTWMRKFNAWCWKQLVHFIFGIKVQDIDCAFKLFRSEFFHSHRLETRGAMINTEMLYKFARAGYTYTEVGVRHMPRKAGQATGAKLSVIFRAFYEMFIYAGKWFKEEIEKPGYE